MIKPQERAHGHIPGCPLTQQQLTVLDLVAEGYGNEEIAQRLKISVQTAKNHLKDINLRLHTPNRTAAVVLALRRGWIEFPEEVTA